MADSIIFSILKPCFNLSSPEFIWRYILWILLFLIHALFNLIANDVESIVSITSKIAIALLILFDCKWPIKWNSILFGMFWLYIFWMVSWTLFSPIIKSPFLYADSIAVKSWVLVTATILIFSKDLCALVAETTIFSLIFFNSFSFTFEITIPQLFLLSYLLLN